MRADTDSRGSATISGPRTAASLGRLLSCIRFEEVLVLQGSPVLGGLVAAHRVTAARGLAVAVLAAGSSCLVAHVFALNDWAGIGADREDPHKGPAVFESQNVTRSEIGGLAMGLLALGLLLLGSLGTLTAIIGFAIAGLSALYSLPIVHAKGVPVLNSALHLVGGTLHFLLGYSVFGLIDQRGLEIGCFFGLTFAAGHLAQEVRDCDGDRASGIRTNAVAFGKRRSFVASLGVFTLADVLLVTMAVRGTVSRWFLLVVGLYPLHLYWSLQALAAGLDFGAIRRLQARYRALYAAVGLATVVGLVWFCGAGLNTGR
jgi:4-hydroxybenzoate polyprenyltransferase